MNNKQRTNLGAIIAIIAVLAFLIPQMIAASAWSDPAYDPILNWISDLGVPIVTKLGTHVIDSPLHMVMNFGFISHAVLAFVSFLLLVPVIPKGRAYKILPIIYSVGVILVGIFPGHEWKFAYLHGLGALMFLLSAHSLSIMYGRTHIKNNSRIIRYMEIILGIIGFVSIPIMFALSTSGYEGLLERMTIYPVFASTIIRSIFYLRNN